MLAACCGGHVLRPCYADIRSISSTSTTWPAPSTSRRRLDGPFNVPPTAGCARELRRLAVLGPRCACRAGWRTTARALTLGMNPTPPGAVAYRVNRVVANAA